MSIHNISIHRSVRQLASESPERWLERLQRLKHDPRLLEQVGPVPQSGREMRAEPPDRWQVRLALLKHNPHLLERFGAFYRQLASLPRRARRWLIRKAALTLTAAALLLAISGAPLAYAAGSITVTTTDPNIVADGQCSLIEAIDNANADAQTHADCPAGSGADIISLPADSTITLTSVNNSVNGLNGLPRITSAITIEGNGATIARDSSAPFFRILLVQQSTGDLTLNNTTITGGHVFDNGGGINNFGTLRLNHSTVSGNAARAGGGLSSSGTLILNHTTVSNNSGATYGGGIMNYASATLEDSTVSNNSGATYGGGIENDGPMTLENSTISGNNADFSGGGLRNRSALTLNNSTVNANQSRYGGGIYSYNQGVTTVNNSTISGNSAAVSGGGVLNGSTRVVLQDSTLTGNSAALWGGGIYNRNSDLSLTRSLISGNTAGNGNEVYGPASGNGNNLIGHDGSAGSVGFTPSGSDIVPSQPLAAILGPLADNGGPTLTHALVTGSPAVDAALTGPTTDQRGVTRPQGAAFDIGAFELEQQALFNFSGFFQPVDNLPTLNTINAGRAIPVKFSLDGDQGLAIFAEGYPVSQQVACEGDAPLDTIEQTVTAGSSSLSYDPATDTYTYVWKTENAWKNTCRTLIVKLSDGTEHMANFRFR